MVLIEIWHEPDVDEETSRLASENRQNTTDQDYTNAISIDECYDAKRWTDNVTTFSSPLIDENSPADAESWWTSLRSCV